MTDTTEVAAVPESIRRQLALLAQRKSSRVSDFSPGLPTVWKPYEVTNPSTGRPFTKDEAWEFIASYLEGNGPVEQVQLKIPPGKTGYVIRVELQPDRPKLYIKLQLGAGTIRCRSFHYDR